MAEFTNPLANVKVASPCPANWNEMIGDERKRFCGQCKLNVYNLSGMTRTEAERLLSNAEGRLCVRFYRRADGSILTEDCPVGWRAFKRRASSVATAVLSLFVAALSGLGLQSAFKQSDSKVLSWIPFSTPTPEPPVLMGAIALPSPTATPKATPKKEKPEQGKVSPTPEEDSALIGEIEVKPRPKKN